MLELSGRELEDFGHEMFTRMGLVCVHQLAQAPLLAIDPSGPYSENQRLEFDYLILHENTCLIGEITGRSGPQNVKAKYRQFRRSFNAVRKASLGEHLWRSIGVPPEYLGQFRRVSDVKGFFITTHLQRFDVVLSRVAGVACFHKSDWQLLEQYSQAIGPYAKHHFLHRFNITENVPRRSLTLRKDSHNLIRIPDKRIASSEVGLANVYTFDASPYELLPIARVYRKDELPRLSSELSQDYQRLLIPKKLRSIRDKLLKSPNFMFPNSILVVLSSDCQYADQTQTLIIPEKYGAIEVIDGQHRLFSYASAEVRREVGDDAKIMVTGIQFLDADEDSIRRYSARTFVEINTNQTRIRPTHLDAIAYPILGETSARAIAAQVILRVNEKRGNSLYGLFDTNQTGLGIIQATTVLVALKTVTNLDRIHKIQNAQRGIRFSLRRGYENLFGVSVEKLGEPEILIERGVVCLEQYFNLVAKIFSNDWPQRNIRRGSSLEYAKMIAGFVKLLNQFISEGLDWDAVRQQLKVIKDNIMQLRQMSTYDAPLFDPSHSDIPDAQPSATDDFRFLNANRLCPTSVRTILAEKHKL